MIDPDTIMDLLGLDQEATAWWSDEEPEEGSSPEKSDLATSIMEEQGMWTGRSE